MNDKYLQSTLEDFLLDDAFVEWVTNDTNDTQWQSWIKENPSKSGEVSDARKMIRILSFQGGKTSSNKERLWAQIEASTQAKEVQLSPGKRRTFLYAASVAAVVTFCAIFFWPDSSIVYNTNQELAEVVTLPANSQVIIEPSSTMKFRKNQWERARNVDLEGRAHFKVTKGVPFTVHTDNGDVRVLGTEFDVISSDNSFYVKVDEGRVEAKSGNYSDILTQNMAFYKNPQWEGEFAMTDEWKADRVQFVFERQPLQFVLRSLSLYYDMEFDSENISSETLYSGSFNTSDTFEKSLQAVFWPLNIDFNITQETVRLSNR